MTRRIDVYFTAMSPWAHLGHAPFMELVAKHAPEVAWRPLALPDLFAETGGLPLPKRSLQRRRYRDVELLRWADRRGRPFKIRPKFWPFDPSLADRCVIALAAEGRDPAAFAGAAMRGTWEEERDLASRDVVAALLSEAGFDPEATFAAAEGEAARAAYAQNLRDAGEIGVFGSPTYVLDGEVFWGQDRLELLDEMLASGRPPYRGPEL